MKIFIYKLLMSLGGVYIIFQLTIGLTVKKLESKVSEMTSKENIELTKKKIREELNNGIKKDRILSSSDAKLLKEFFNQISSEINSK